MSSRPSEEAVRPLPSEEDTPPVKKMNLVSRRTAPDRHGRSRCPGVARPSAVPRRVAAGHPRQAPDEASGTRAGHDADPGGGAPARSAWPGSAGRVTAGLASSSSRAWRRAESLSGWPDSIRLNSTTRPSPSRAATSERVRPDALGLAHLDLVVGLGGHLGQVGDHQHLAVAGRARPGPSPRRWPPPRPRRRRPRRTPSRPGPSVMARRMASMVRASSPPEAAVARGSSGSPGLAPSRNVDLVGRPVPLDGDLEPGRGHGQVVQGGLDRARPARGRRPGGPSATSARRVGPARPGPCRSRRRGPGPAAPRASMAASRARASSAKARTSARVSPYLRRSWWRSCRRLRISSRRSGSSSQVSTTDGARWPGRPGRPWPTGPGRRARPAGARPSSAAAASASRSRALAPSAPGHRGQCRPRRPADGRPAVGQPFLLGLEPARPRRRPSMPAPSISPIW